MGWEVGGGWAAVLWTGTVCWATSLALAAVCCQKKTATAAGPQMAGGATSLLMIRGSTRSTQLQSPLAEEQPVRPRQPETPAQAARSREIRAGRLAKRKDPAYKTLAEIRSDWSNSQASASGPRLEPGPDEADPTAAAIRAGKRLRRKDPDGDSFQGIVSDWDSSGPDPDPAGTRDGGTRDEAPKPETTAAAKPAPTTAHTRRPPGRAQPGPSRDPNDVHSDFLV